MTAPRCEGNGYTERWNDDQSGVVIELCPGCEDCWPEPADDGRRDHGLLADDYHERTQRP